MSKLLAQVDFNTKSLPRIYYCRHGHVTSLALLPLPSTLSFQFRPLKLGRSQSRSRSRRDMASPTSAFLVFSQNPVVGDVVATALTGAIALSSLRVWEETARRGLFDQVILKCLFVCWSELCPYSSYTFRLSDSLSDCKYYLVYWIFLICLFGFSWPIAVLTPRYRKLPKRIFLGFFLLETSIFAPDRG